MLGCDWMKTHLSWWILEMVGNGVWTSLETVYLTEMFSKKSCWAGLFLVVWFLDLEWRHFVFCKE